MTNVRISKPVKSLDGVRVNMQDVHPNQAAFLRAVQARVKGCYFIQNGAQTVDVAIEGYPMTLGRIGQYDKQHDGAWVPAYYVESDFIENRRGRQSRVSSIRLPVAARNAGKHLRRHLWHDVVNSTVNNANRTIGSAVLEPHKNLRHEYTEMVGGYNSPTPDTILELRNMITQGYVFVSNNYKKHMPTIARYIGEYDAMVAEMAEVNPYTFVTFEVFGDQPRYMISVRTDMNSSGQIKLNRNAEVTRTPIAEVPDTIKGSIACLAMVEDESGVDGVGYKICEGMYYVQA